MQNIIIPIASDSAINDFAIVQKFLPFPTPHKATAINTGGKYFWPNHTQTLYFQLKVFKTIILCARWGGLLLAWSKPLLYRKHTESHNVRMKFELKNISGHSQTFFTQNTKSTKILFFCYVNILTAKKYVWVCACFWLGA